MNSGCIKAGIVCVIAGVLLLLFMLPCSSVLVAAAIALVALGIFFLCKSR